MRLTLLLTSVEVIQKRRGKTWFFFHLTGSSTFWVGQKWLLSLSVFFFIIFPKSLSLSPLSVVLAVIWRHDFLVYCCCFHNVLATDYFLYRLQSKGTETSNEWAQFSAAADWETSKWWRIHEYLHTTEGWNLSGIFTFLDWNWRRYSNSDTIFSALLVIVSLCTNVNKIWTPRLTPDTYLVLT